MQPARFNGFQERVQRAAEVAKHHASEVDATTNFPHAAFQELRQQRLLAILVPQSFGGEGATLSDVVDACHTLGQACSSTALIFAMHQIKMACIIRHNRNSPTLDALLRRTVYEQLLFASSTTEGTGGGNIRSSDAAIIQEGDVFHLERQAAVISYGLEADGIVTTARRSVDAASSSQVLAVLLKSDYTLEHRESWDTLGMRGTHSEGYLLKAHAGIDQILADPYEKIHGQTMVPFAHLAWGAVWMGIASAATAKAQSFIRNAMRKSGGAPPPGASQYGSAVTTLRTLRAVLASSLRRYEAIMDDEKALNALEFQGLMATTKIQSSELAVATVLSCLRACGLSGYRNDKEFSIGRHLRDILSAPLMINNDRILSNLAAASLMTSLPVSITD